MKRAPVCVRAPVLQAHCYLLPQGIHHFMFLYKYLSSSCNGESCHKCVHKCFLVRQMFSHLILKNIFSFSFYPFHLVFSFGLITYQTSKGSCSFEASINTEWGKSRFAVLSTWNSLFLYCYLLLYYFTNKCKPTFASLCIFWMVNQSLTNVDICVYNWSRHHALHKHQESAIQKNVNAFKKRPRWVVGSVCSDN